jgi:hypothetical protein
LREEREKLVQSRATTTNGPREIKGLVAEGPDPDLKEKLALFGQFVGDWEGVSQFFKPDGTARGPPEDGEVHWGWILAGTAVQDVWMYHDKKTGKAMPGGTTIRFYDPKIDAWQSIWITPIGNKVISFIGRKVGETIVLEAEYPEGTLLKWSFSNIKTDSFTWLGEESGDQGKTWTLVTRMLIHRRK